jgi:predicted kinase
MSNIIRKTMVEAFGFRLRVKESMARTTTCPVGFQANDPPVDKSMVETIIDNPKGLLKCVFLTGGAGAGKSFVVKNLFPSISGNRTDNSAGSDVIHPAPKILDSDALFTRKLTSAGLPQKIPSASDIDNSELRTKQLALRDKAMTSTIAVLKNVLNGYFSVILDGTGKSADKMIQRKLIMESLGYDCLNLVVSTSLQIAQDRNKKRTRSLPPDAVEEIWHQVQQNIPKYKQLFGKNCVVVNNDPGQLDVQFLREQLTQFLTAPVQNPVGQELLANKDKGSITRSVSPEALSAFESDAPIQH